MERELDAERAAKNFGAAVGIPLTVVMLLIERAKDGQLDDARREFAVNDPSEYDTGGVDLFAEVDEYEYDGEEEYDEDDDFDPEYDPDDDESNNQYTGMSMM